MYDVYILQSESTTNRFYVGSTENLKRRVLQHNAGNSKAGSGKAFAKRHF